MRKSVTKSVSCLQKRYCWLWDVSTWSRARGLTSFMKLVLL